MFQDLAVAKGISSSLEDKAKMRRTLQKNISESELLMGFILQANFDQVGLWVLLD